MAHVGPLFTKVELNPGDGSGWMDITAEYFDYLDGILEEKNGIYYMYGVTYDTEGEYSVQARATYWDNEVVYSDTETITVLPPEDQQASWLSELTALTTPAGVDGALFEQLKQALAVAITAAPLREARALYPEELALNLAYNADTGVVSWDYNLTSDYDADGEVGFSDLTPLGLNLGAIVGDGVGNAAEEAWVDGDKNGEVNVADVTVLGRDFGQRVDGYRVLAAEYVWDDDPPDFGFTEVGVVTPADALPGWPPRFEFTLPGAGEQYVRLEELGTDEYSLHAYRACTLDLGDDPPGFFEWEPWVTRSFIDPRDESEYEIIDGRVIIAFKEPYDRPAAFAWMNQMMLYVYSEWPEVGGAAVLLPYDITVEEAVGQWPGQYPELLEAVDPDVVF